MPVPEAPLRGESATVSRAQSPERLPESASLLLDGVRFGLALLVVIGHMTLPFFSTAWPPLLWLADAAVPGFFVLSGFMIRYVSEDRERDPRRYFISRASRMYSVVLPAIAFTLLCSAWIAHRSPVYARTLFHHESGAATIGQIAAHLLFYTQFWGHAVLLPPNLPLWSLGFEVPYYVLFGLLVLCRGSWRWWAAALYALLLGPQVVFLLALWWSGCWLYDLWQWLRQPHRTRAFVALASLLSVAALIALLIPVNGQSGWWRIAYSPNVLTVWLHQPPARANMLAYASGAVAWCAMLLGLVASDRVRLRRNAPWARPVRRLAEGTFTLYLFHYPMLCLVVPAIGHVLRTSAATFAVTALITAACVLLAVPIDRLKSVMRRQLNAHFVPR